MTSANLPIGSKIGGKYQLLRLLGEGGMGAVFEAQNELTLKRVAVKVMHAALAADEQAAARMLREAQTSSRVRHPNVVDVYDAGHEGGTIFLVMEFLEGEPFGDGLKREGMMVHDAISYLVDAMRGVAAAHRAGVIHRDIKPDNIFLAKEGESLRPVPKVLDFGVSKLADDTSLRLTRTDVTIGTPLYMSYEQLSGMREGLDARADVYAFGVILYELLTGRPPHPASTLSQLAMLVATVEPPPPRELRAEIPQALDAVVRSAIAKHREQRTPSLDVLMRGLEPFTRADTYAKPLPVAASQEVVALEPTQPDTKDGRTVPLSISDRVSTPVAGTAPSLPTIQRPQTKRVMAIGAAVGCLIGAVVLLPQWSKEPAPPPPLPPPAARVAEKRITPDDAPPLTPPTHMVPVNDPPLVHGDVDLGARSLALSDAGAADEREGKPPEAAAPPTQGKPPRGKAPGTNDGPKQPLVKPPVPAGPKPDVTDKGDSAEHQKGFRAGRVKRDDF